MMIKVFSLSVTAISFWVLTYFLPKAITHAADLTYSSDCVICPRDAKTNEKLDLIALPLNLETLTKIRGYYDGAILTSAQKPDFLAPGYINFDQNDNLIATETRPGLAVSLGHASRMAGRAHLCFRTDPQGPDSHFVGALNTDILCNYTLYFNNSAHKWDPFIGEPELYETGTHKIIMHSHELTWAGETTYIEEPVYFIKSSSQVLYLGIGLKTGTTFVWNDFSSLPQFNIIHLIFRNLFCTSPTRGLDINRELYIPICSDAYLSVDMYRRFSDYQGFANIYNHTWFRARGFTTDVSIRGTGFFFLCGQFLYLQLPRFWHGTCTVVAILPDALIYQPEDMKFLGSHTTLSSFLKTTLISFEVNKH